VTEAKLSIILPAFNESERLRTNLSLLVETMNWCGYQYEIIVVDDGSSDGTWTHAVEAANVLPATIRVIYYEQNEGKGHALLCGARHASGTHVVFIDADMELHPFQVPLLFEMMRLSEADVVIGSKHHVLSKTVNYPRVRKAYSLAYYAVVRLMFGLPVRDTQTGLKIFKRQVAEHVFPRVMVKRFGFDIEILANAHRLGYTIVDAPVVVHFSRGFGRIKWQDAFLTLLDTLAIFYRMKLLRYYDRVAETTLLSELRVNPRSREVSHRSAAETLLVPQPSAAIGQ
jgi:glycosyltransferase involved in cell wall biosynthesis